MTKDEYIAKYGEAWEHHAVSREWNNKNMVQSI